MNRRVETAPTFERNLKQLGRRYRRIRHDLEPLIERLVAGHTPGDRLRGVAAIVYKVRLPMRTWSGVVKLFRCRRGMARWCAWTETPATAMR